VRSSPPTTSSPWMGLGRWGRWLCEGAAGRWRDMPPFQTPPPARRLSLGPGGNWPFGRVKRRRSEGTRHAEDVLADVGQDQVGGDGSHLVEAGLPELALDVVLLGEAVPAVELHGGVGRLP